MTIKDLFWVLVDNHKFIAIQNLRWVLTLFKGEKTNTFWIGLVVFGYCIYQFCRAIWLAFYNYYFVYAENSSFYILFTELPGVADYLSTLDNLRLPRAIGAGVPSVILGIIFLVIGLYIMKRGVRKNQPPTQQLE